MGCKQEQLYQDGAKDIKTEAANQFLFALQKSSDGVVQKLTVQVDAYFFFRKHSVEQVATTTKKLRSNTSYPVLACCKVRLHIIQL